MKVLKAGGRNMRMMDIGITSTHLGESKSPPEFLKKAKYKLSTGMINTLDAWIFYFNHFY